MIVLQAAGGIYEELGDDRLGNFGGGLTPTPAGTGGTTSVPGGSVRNGGGGRVCGDDGGRRGDCLGPGARLPHAAAAALPGG